ncbi:mannitol dehydrogenase family protein [Actinoplanes aureus]|uniref:Mannitol-1-phosphate 5-dehydrogenase n=1 Tax=Actinoplanes aureus TaxID=2792083 RepID=A0A931C793_9ACTN|nr:mannitol dehydrogenase family protein [Actinoplanes aureus]MBG0564744.1 mannitol dehydrogenase family protein [Actinoplanes aureus]
MRPVRVVHLGLGGFFRAHQAWYTGAAPDAEQWGIAAFTGRSPDLADQLRRQDGKYTLIVRGPAHDEMSVQRAVVAAHSGTDHAVWCDYLARPEVAVVTLTVTEAAYRRDRTGDLDLDDPGIRADLEALRHGGDPLTVPGRLVAGLAARRAARAGSLAVVSCDNLPGNGPATEQVIGGLAEAVEPALAAWITEHVSFVTTMVDRITPRTTADDVRAVATRTGWADQVPVVTEPFTEWVLGGEFPSGRPAWEAAGARFADDVHPYETRKLFLLNGGHSLLAYAGSALGHDTIAEAVTDPVCRRWLDQWWDEAVRHVPLPAADLTTYRAALLERFANPRIRHTLAQIAADGSQKLPIRVLPVVRAERAAGRTPAGAARILAAWIEHLRGIGAPVDDAAAGPYRDRAGSVREVITLLAPDLADDEALLTAIGGACRTG